MEDLKGGQQVDFFPSLENIFFTTLELQAAREPFKGNLFICLGRGSRLQSSAGPWLENKTLR